MNSAAGGPGRRSSRGGGSCTTPLMVRSGGTSRAWTFCPSVCNDGGRVEVDVPCGGCCPALDKVAVSWRQSGERKAA